jgi:hypothetical protein
MNNEFNCTVSSKNDAKQNDESAPWSRNEILTNQQCVAGSATTPIVSNCNDMPVPNKTSQIIETAHNNFNK